MTALLLAAGGGLAASAPLAAQDQLAQAAPACLVLRQAVAAGSFITHANAGPGDCDADAGPSEAIRYDRAAGAVLALADLPAGAALGRVALPAGPVPLPAGTRLRMQWRSGPVLVEQEVRTLQPARPGERVFVATQQGEVFSALVDKGVVQ